MSTGPESLRGLTQDAAVDASLHRLMEEVWNRFGSAERSGPGAQAMDVRIAGSGVRMRFATATLRGALGRAFEHLRLNRALDRPELTIGVWDSVSSGVEMPPPPWGRECLSGRGDIIGWQSTSTIVAYQVNSGILSIFQPESGRAAFWIRDASAISRHVRCTPLLPIINWWTQRLGMQLVHAGAVGGRSGAALLAGAGGAGKSCTAIACARAGMSYASDDYCVIAGGAFPTVHSAYSTGKLHMRDVERMGISPEWIHRDDSTGGEKSMMFLNECLPQSTLPDMPLRVILLPRLSRTGTSYCEAAPSAAAMVALFRVTIQLPSTGQHAVDVISGLSRSLPCYFLNLGAGDPAIPHVIQAKIRECM